jgi:hypothetical protein
MFDGLREQLGISVGMLGYKCEGTFEACSPLSLKTAMTNMTLGWPELPLTGTKSWGGFWEQGLFLVNRDKPYVNHCAEAPSVYLAQVILPHHQDMGRGEHVKNMW